MLIKTLIVNHLMVYYVTGLSVTHSYIKSSLLHHDKLKEIALYITKMEISF